MYKIIELELKGFIGLRKVNDNNDVFKLSLKDDLDKEIIMIFGENGLGKTTLLENLTPFPEMLSRKTKESITFPAFKKISFLNTKDNKVLRLEVFWNSPTETKGYIYEDDVMLDNTKKGNITEFNTHVLNTFGDFDKFKHSLFLQQGIIEIVKAKPTERVKIINSFMTELDIYNEIKSSATTELENGKLILKRLLKEIEELETYENRYNDILKFQKDFDFTLFESEKEKFIELEKKLLDSSIRLNHKKSKELELDNTKSTLLSLENQDINSQLNDVISKIEELEVSSKLFDSTKLQASITSSNQNIIKLENLIAKLDIDTRFSDFTYNEISSELKTITSKNTLIQEEANSLSIQKKGLADLFSKTGNLDSLTKRKELLEIELKSIETKTLKYENLSLDTISNEIFNTKQILKNNDIALNDIKSKQNEIDSKNEKLKSFTSSVEDIDSIKKKLFDISLKEVELSKLDTSINNTTDSNSCSTCGQSVDIEQLIQKRDVLSNEIKSIDKRSLESNLVTIEKEALEKNTLLTEISSLNNFIKELNTLSNEEVISYNEKLDELILKKTNISDYNAFISLTTPIVNKIDVLNPQIDTLVSDISSIKKEFDSSIESIKEIDDKIIELQSTILKNNDTIRVLNNIIENTSDFKDESLTFSELHTKTKDELSSVSSSLSQSTLDLEKINDINSKIKTFKEKQLFLTSENTKYQSHLIKKNDLEKSLAEYNDISDDILNTVNSEKNDLKSIIEAKNTKILENKKDQEVVEEKLKRFRELKQECIDIDNKNYLLSKIKNYSDRIKKASISEFFNNISSFINQIISSEKGTLGDLKLRISQKNAKQFDILVDNGGTEVKDISLLSGAEQGTVARAIYFALAQFSNFGVIWLDECDGMLSDTNKEVFIEMLIKMKDLIGLNQVFLISHNQNIISKTDKLIDLNILKT